MPSKDIKILEFNQYQKSDKLSFTIHADLECTIEKSDNPKNLSRTKISEHIASDFSMPTISSLTSI